MNGLISVISTALVNGYREIKCTLFGNKDTRTAKEASPHGIDSCPTKDSRGILVETYKTGHYYVISYTTTERKAQPGETRFFSTTITGTTTAEVWFRTDGTIELNGKTDNVVRYIPLNSALQSQAAQINSNLTAILTNLTQLNAAVNALAPGSVTTPYTPSPVTINITAAKVLNVKTSS